MAKSIVTKAGNHSLAVSALDMKQSLRKGLRRYWQHTWDAEVSNKLHLVKPYLGNWPPTTKVRRTEVTLCRHRIGHTYDTHSYLLTRGEPPVCVKCGGSLTVLHVLLECREVEYQRKKTLSIGIQTAYPTPPCIAPIQ